jgi:hypothetical protein
MPKEVQVQAVSRLIGHRFPYGWVILFHIERISSFPRWCIGPFPSEREGEIRHDYCFLSRIGVVRSADELNKALRTRPVSSGAK